MIKTRNSVFETNSSSVHSLSIDKSGLEPSKLYQNKNGEIIVPFGSFGKNLEYYNSQDDKLSYLITCLSYCSRGLSAADAVYGSYAFEHIEDAIKEYTGCTKIVIDDRNDPDIDHQSQPDSEWELIIDAYDKDEIINFVFNKYISLKTYCD